jgi:hypothetical protein
LENFYRRAVGRNYIKEKMIVIVKKRKEEEEDEKENEEEEIDVYVTKY